MSDLALKGTILVVDDTSSSLLLQSSVLTAHGYKVLIADCGELALASVEAQPPDLILLDIYMPGMDGFEVLRRLKAHTELRDIPVILLSAANEVEKRVEGLNLGAVDYITKPFRFDELLARVRTHLWLRQTQQDLNAANRDLEKKNIELESFTYTVSHDLKSPLITIQSYAGQIMQDLEEGSNARIQGDLKRITDAAAKMTALLDDLLKLSRVGRMMDPPSRVDMDRLVKDVLMQLAGPLEQRQTKVAVQPGLPGADGDRLRIAMLLQNLVENAIKYMGDQESPRIWIGAREEGKVQVFYVKDNGSGIDPRHHESIFDLFRKLDATTGGTGIGLALVKRIIEVHGGRVWVESDGAGKGSTFCFTLTRKCPASDLIVQKKESHVDR